MSANHDCSKHDGDKPVELTPEKIKELQQIVPFQNLRKAGDVLPSMKMGDYYMPMWLTLGMDKIANFPVDPGDIWVCTFPKSGTTWVQQIVWLLATRDFEKARTVPIDDRFPEIEIPAPYPPTPENIDKIGERPMRPRLIKSHLAYCMLPKKIGNAKIIYVYRNPKDMLVSFYHFYQAWTASYYDGTFEDLANAFINETITYGPWPRHVKDFLEVSRRPNSHVMMVAYEDLKKDRLGWIQKIADFLGLAVQQSELQAISDATSFESMKFGSAANYDWLHKDGWMDPARQPFIRKGIVGDWKNYFSTELAAKFDAYVKHHMDGCGLEFQYE